MTKIVLWIILLTYRLTKHKILIKINNITNIQNEKLEIKNKNNKTLLYKYNHQRAVI